MGGGGLPYGPRAGRGPREEGMADWPIDETALQNGDWRAWH